MRLTKNKAFLVAAIVWLTVAPASAFSLLAPVEHDWTVAGAGIRGYPNGYTAVVFGSYHHVFHLPFSTVAAAVLLFFAASAAVGATAIRGPTDEKNEG